MCFLYRFSPSNEYEAKLTEINTLNLLFYVMCFLIIENLLLDIMPSIIEDLLLNSMPRIDLNTFRRKFSVPSNESNSSLKLKHAVFKNGLLV